MHAILKHDQQYFDSSQGLKEYERVVGLPPDMAMVSLIKAILADTNP